MQKKKKRKSTKTKFYIQVSQIFVLLTGIKIRYVLRSCQGFLKIYEIILQVTVSKHNENYKFSMLPSTAWTKNLYAVGAICTFHLLSGQCLERICSCFFCHFLNAQSFTLHIMFKRLSLKYITPASILVSSLLLLHSSSGMYHQALFNILLHSKMQYFSLSCLYAAPLSELACTHCGCTWQMTGFSPEYAEHTVYLTKYNPQWYSTDILERSF